MGFQCRTGTAPERQPRRLDIVTARRPRPSTTARKSVRHPNEVKSSRSSARRSSVGATTKDMFTVEVRSAIMRAVRTRGTDPEERLAAALTALGLSFKRHDQKLPGTPDFLFVRQRLAVFVDGDFWHGRTWFARGEAPVGNRAFWIRKFESNRRRDRRVDRALRQLGWAVVHLWGTDVRRAPDRAAARIVRRLELTEHRGRNRAATIIKRSPNRTPR